MRKEQTKQVRLEALAYIDDIKKLWSDIPRTVADPSVKWFSRNQDEEPPQDEKHKIFLERLKTAPGYITTGSYTDDHVMVYARNFVPWETPHDKDPFRVIIDEMIADDGRSIPSSFLETFIWYLEQWELLYLPLERLYATKHHDYILRLALMNNSFFIAKKHMPPLRGEYTPKIELVFEKAAQLMNNEATTETGREVLQHMLLWVADVSTGPILPFGPMRWMSEMFFSNIPGPGVSIENAAGVYRVLNTMLDKDNFFPATAVLFQIAMDRGIGAKELAQRLFRGHRYMVDYVRGAQKFTAKLELLREQVRRRVYKKDGFYSDPFFHYRYMHADSKLLEILDEWLKDLGPAGELRAGATEPTTAEVKPYEKLLEDIRSTKDSIVADLELCESRVARYKDHSDAFKNNDALRVALNTATTVRDDTRIISTNSNTLWVESEYMLLAVRTSIDLKDPYINAIHNALKSNSVEIQKLYNRSDQAYDFITKDLEPEIQAVHNDLEWASHINRDQKEIDSLEKQQQRLRDPTLQKKYRETEQKRYEDLLRNPHKWRASDPSTNAKSMTFDKWFEVLDKSESEYANQIITEDKARIEKKKVSILENKENARLAPEILNGALGRWEIIKKQWEQQQQQVEEQAPPPPPPTTNPGTTNKGGAKIKKRPV